MYAHNVSCNVLVTIPIVVILHDEDHIETRQDSSLEVDILPWCFEVIVPTKDRVCGGQDGRSRIQNGRDTCFGNGDGLLFHGFVDGDLVGDVHFVEFVDRADAAAVLKELVSYFIDRGIG